MFFCVHTTDKTVSLTKELGDNLMMDFLCVHTTDKTVSLTKELRDNLMMNVFRAGN